MVRGTWGGGCRHCSLHPTPAEAETGTRRLVGKSFLQATGIATRGIAPLPRIGCGQFGPRRPSQARAFASQIPTSGPVPWPHVSRRREGGETWARGRSHAGIVALFAGRGGGGAALLLESFIEWWLGVPRGGGWRARLRGQIEDICRTPAWQPRDEKKGIAISMRQPCQLHIMPPPPFWPLEPWEGSSLPAVGCLAAVCTLRRNGRHGVAFSFPGPRASEVTGERES